MDLNPAGWLRFLMNGGPIMWPLLACALVALGVIIERWMVIGRAATDTEELLEQVRRHLSEGRIADALALAEGTRGPVASLVASGIRNQDLDADAIERSMEELALRETPVLYKRLGILDTVITIAPLLGLLGTVTGMIKAFNVVGNVGLNQPMGITGGVAEALIATATGLAIAIVTLIAYNYLTEKVKEIISEMETRATQLLNILASLRAKSSRAEAAAPMAGGAA
jgi:biopolymer transport protein ExbB